MTNAKDWVIAAAFVAAFLCLCSVLDGATDDVLTCRERPVLAVRQ